MAALHEQRRRRHGPNPSDPSGDANTRATGARVARIALGVAAEHGFAVELTRPPEAHGGEFARLEVTRGGETMHLDLARDWRKGQPVQLAVGPVLQLDDAVSSKVNAMVTRRLPRDFIDVAASLKRYTRSELMRLAFGRDPGLRVIDFTDAARELDRLTIDVFRKYGLDDHAVTALRDVFADWPRNENDDEDGQAIHAATAR